jgi:hypothetical protein
MGAISNFNPLFFPQIKQEQEELRTPSLGIYIGNVPDQYLSDAVKMERAVYVDHVMADTEAEKAGITAGDIIIAVDGILFKNREANPQDQLKKTIREKNIGDSLELSIVRDGKPMIVKAKIGEMKKIPARVKPHPEIDAIQRSLDNYDSEIYKVLQGGNSLGGFIKTMTALKEKSLLLDNYKVTSDNPFRLSEINYILQNPTDIIPVSREITSALLNYFNDEAYDLRELIREISWRLDVEFQPDRGETPTINSIDDVTRYMIEVFSDVESYRNAAFEELSEEEISFLEEETLGILSGNDATPEMDVRFLKVATKVDYQMLCKSIAEASRAISLEIIHALGEIEVKALKRHPDIPTDVVDGDVIEIIETKYGRIIIGGPGKTHYKVNAFTIIDFGGDDLYENNAGASTPEYPFSIVIDLAGDDKYIANGNLSQGAGFMGIGILADIQGDDLYISGNFSMGAGVFGGGILMDLDGDDVFIADSYTEGAGIFGIGLLLNTRGNDIYESRRASQGFASVKGFGALVDLRGEDTYIAGGKYPDHRDPEHSTKSLSQGFAIGIRPYESPVGASGGIGVLIDKEGDDKYIADYFSQGSSYWYALGILHDMKGDDTYFAGRYSQGAGIHISAGSLIDETGNDSYMITYGVSQGMGHDFGIGVLADFYGNDTYRGGVLSQGAATCGSLGILYDEDGRDAYFIHDGKESDGKGDYSCGARGFGMLMNDKSGERL